MLVSWTNSLLLFVITLFTEIYSAQTIDCETYSGQRSLVRNEQQLIEALVDYKIELEQIIFAIRNYTTNYATTVLNPLKKISVHPLTQDFSVLDGDKISVEISKSPIMTLHLFQRLVIKLNLIEEQTKKHKIAENNLRRLLGRSGPILKLDRSDLLENMGALMHLFLAHDINSDDLESGRLDGIETNFGLSEQNFFEFGLYAANVQFFSFAINFLLKARDIIKSKENEGKSYDRALQRRVNNNLKETINSHNKYLDSNQTMTYLFKDKVVLDETKNIPEFPKEVKIYSDLCRGKRTNIGTNEKRPLKCFLSSKSNAYWLLSPLKIEVHSRSPLIFQYYDIMTDSQLESLKVITLSQLERSKVITDEGVTLKESSRISASATLRDPLQKASTSLKVQLITGLKAMTEDDAENLQVTNYVTAGHFVPHFDPFLALGKNVDQETLDDTTKRGDRIATFMFYLNNVEGGGRTVFSQIGLTVDPVKGSALFWYNLHPDGTTDYRTMHAGCSVLYGSKWMSTKWIRSHGQMFLQKCDVQKSTNWFYDSYGLEN